MGVDGGKHAAGRRPGARLTAGGVRSAPEDSEGRDTDVPEGAGRPSFEAWYRAEHPRLLAAMTVIGGSPEPAQEAVDEALARALERWSRVSAMASPGGWTYRVALHCLRRRERRRALEERLLHRVAAGSVVAVAGPAGEAWDVVRGLPTRQRAVVALRYVADLSQAEIAEVLGVTRSTVSSTLTDAHRALGRLLDESEEATR